LEGEMVGGQKQRGHRAPPKGMRFNDRQKTQPKKFCDLRTCHHTVFSLASDQYCRTERFPGHQRRSAESATRLTRSTDEISIRKGRRHPTAVSDGVGARALFVVQRCTAGTLMHFFRKPKPGQATSIETVVMDTWDRP